MAKIQTLSDCRLEIIQSIAETTNKLSLLINRLYELSTLLENGTEWANLVDFTNELGLIIMIFHKNEDLQVSTTKYTKKINDIIHNINSFLDKKYIHT